MDYILDLLDANGFDEAFLTLGYLPEPIVTHYPDARHKRVSLNFVTEKAPLGTAGGVKNAAGEFGEDFLVISGDAMCDFELGQIMRYHRENQADATLVVTRVGDPREYGLVNVDEKTRAVAGFVEKPSYAQAVCDLANTGVYILSPEAMKLIPDNKPFDFAKELFPLMLRLGKKVLAYEEKGYWCDVGDLDSLRRCAQDMLTQRVRCDIHAKELEGVYYKDAADALRVVVKAPAYIGVGVTVGQGSRIGEGTVLDDGVCVGARASVLGSLVGVGAVLGDDVRLRGAVVCEGAVLENGARLFEGAAVGAKAVVGNRATIEPSVKVWPMKYVRSGTVQSEHLRAGALGRELFDDDGVCVESPGEMTPAMCARLGGAIGTIMKKGVVGVFYSGKAGEALCDALCAGIRQTGCSVWDFGECIEPQGVFCAVHCKLRLSVFVEAGRIRLFSAEGLSLARDTERSIELCMQRAETRSVPFEGFGRRVFMNSVSQLYFGYLSELGQGGFRGQSVCVLCANPVIKRVLSSVLDDLGCKVGRAGAVRLRLSEDGRELSASQSGGKRLSDERVLTVVAERELASGENIAVRFDAPRALDLLAENHGRSVLRYLSCPADTSDRRARLLAKGQPWVRDGLARAVMLLAILTKEGKTVYELSDALPAFSGASRVVALTQNPCEIMRRLGAPERGEIGEGVVLPYPNGTVLVRPLKRGGGLRVSAEALNFEIARELCGELEARLKKLEKGDGER